MPRLLHLVRRPPSMIFFQLEGTSILDALFTSASWYIVFRVLSCRAALAYGIHTYSSRSSVLEWTYHCDLNYHAQSHLTSRTPVVHSKSETETFFLFFPLKKALWHGLIPEMDGSSDSTYVSAPCGVINNNIKTTRTTLMVKFTVSYHFTFFGRKTRGSNIDFDKTMLNASWEPIDTETDSGSLPQIDLFLRSRFHRSMIDLNKMSYPHAFSMLGLLAVALIGGARRSRSRVTSHPAEVGQARRIVQHYSNCFCLALVLAIARASVWRWCFWVRMQRGFVGWRRCRHGGAGDRGVAFDSGIWIVQGPCATRPWQIGIIWGHTVSALD